jgi:glutathione transport system substrate-binding protein
MPEDKRYDATYHNKDPWIDSKVRKAMAIAIDREAICKAIFAGYAKPAGIPLFTKDMDKYLYSYEPATARQRTTNKGMTNTILYNTRYVKLLALKCGICMI